MKASVSRVCVGALLVMALVTGGCADGSSAPDGDTAKKTPPPVAEASRVVPARLKVTMAGDVAMSWESEADVTILDMRNPPYRVQILSVGIQQLQPVDDRQRFRFAFDLMDRYSGPGTYEIPALPEGPAGKVASNAFAIHVLAKEGVSRDQPLTPQDAERTLQFNLLPEPCRLEIQGDDEDRGTLDCPVVREAGGAQVALRVEWELIE